MRISDWSSDVCSSDLRLVNDVYALLRVDPDETVDDLIAAGCADGAFDRVALLRAVQAWASGTAAEQPKSKLLAEWLAGEDGARVEKLALYRSEEHTSEIPSLIRVTLAAIDLTKK